MDLVATNSSGLGISFLSGRGDGTFQNAANSSLPGAPWVVATADFDHDGHTDLAVTRYNLSVVSVLLGNGNGTFSVPLSYPVGTGPQYVSVADFDDDGNDNLAVTSQQANNVSVLLGNGDGTFRYAPDNPVAVGRQPFGLDVADFDEDGYPDVAVAEQISDSITILLSNRQVAPASVTYDGDTLVSTEGASTAEVNLIAALRDDEDNVLDINDEVITFSLVADGVSPVTESALSDGGVAHAVVALEPGVYSIEVTLASFDLTASAELVVYNPSGGFVTGGGTILPANDGSNTHPNVRANFGFNAKYRRGVPIGQAEFRSLAGRIDLKSTSIELLVISAGRIAHFWGWASVNRQRGYWFSVTAVDNGEPGVRTDTFEIQVCAPGTDPAVDEPTETSCGVLRGGNIQVHVR